MKFFTLTFGLFCILASPAFAEEVTVKIVAVSCSDPSHAVNMSALRGQIGDTFVTSRDYLDAMREGNKIVLKMFMGSDGPQHFAYACPEGDLLKMEVVVVP